MFDFDITTDPTETMNAAGKKTTKKVVKRKVPLKPVGILQEQLALSCNSLREKGLPVPDVLKELIEINDDRIAKKYEEIKQLQSQNVALTTKKDMIVLLQIRRGLAKATILRIPNEEKSTKLIAKLHDFDQALNIDKSDLDPCDIYYFQK